MIKLSNQHAPEANSKNAKNASNEVDDKEKSANVGNDINKAPDDKASDSEGKSAMNSTTPNSNFRNTKPESLSSSDTNKNKYRTTTDALSEPQHISPKKFTDDKDPLAYRFRKIMNLKIMDKNEKSGKSEDNESDSNSSQPPKPKTNNFFQSSKQKANESTIHFEPTVWAPSDDRFLTLEDCLDYYIEAELLKDKKNLYQCENCTKEKYGEKSKKKAYSPAIKRSIILTLPWNLIINLKRFSHSHGYFSKSSKGVKFPRFLHMDKYTMQEVPKSDEDNINLYTEAKHTDEWSYKHTYELYGIVTHSGGMGGGHYVAYVCYFLKDKRFWFYFSDSHVQDVSEEDALKAEAYILFYRK